MAEFLMLKENGLLITDLGNIFYAIQLKLLLKDFRLRIFSITYKKKSQINKTLIFNCC